MPQVEPLVAIKKKVLHTTKLTAEKVGSSVYVTYDTLENNRPLDYKNVIAVYQGDQVPYNDAIPPVAFATVNNNSPKGDQTIAMNFEDNVSYTVGYAVGTSQAQVVAAVPLPDTGTSVQGFPRMDLLKLGTHTIQLQYILPDGCRPKSFAHMVALYEGHLNPFTDYNPLRVEPVPSNDSNGQVTINNVNIFLGRQYTLAYFAGPQNTLLCMTIYFET